MKSTLKYLICASVVRQCPRICISFCHFTLYFDSYARSQIYIEIYDWCRASIHYRICLCVAQCQHSVISAFQFSLRRNHLPTHAMLARAIKSTVNSFDFIICPFLLVAHYAHFPVHSNFLFRRVYSARLTHKHTSVYFFLLRSCTFRLQFLSPSTRECSSLFVSLYNILSRRHKTHTHTHARVDAFKLNHLTGCQSGNN